MRDGGAQRGVEGRDLRLLASRHLGWLRGCFGRNGKDLSEGCSSGDGLDKNRRRLFLRSGKVEKLSRARGVEEISKKDSYSEGQQEGQQFGWGQ